MKKINSNSYGHKVIGLAALFLVPIPLCFYFLGLLFEKVFMAWIYLSLAAGLFILLSFSVWLTIEFHQDRMIEQKYADIRKTKMLLENGVYECQSCGNRNIIITDNRCSICGVVFCADSEKSLGKERWISKQENGQNK